MRLRINAMWEDFQAPVWEKLLPDPLPFPYQRPYTLVVDLDELLVHSHWTREHGWRTAKRPGLDYFLAYLSQFWEIVLFTTQPYYVVAPVIEKLDPDRRYIAYTLFRESCRTHQGKVVKDLSALNRDLSKVVVLDTEADRYSMQPENGILMKKWDGSRNDAELVGMIPFLEGESRGDWSGPSAVFECKRILTWSLLSSALLPSRCSNRHLPDP
jgi:import inner membrane translocase subunit TIM50